MKEKYLYNDIKKYLNDHYNFNDEIIDEIYNKIDYYTNENLNFVYYKTGYDDEIGDDIIIDFLDEYGSNKYESIDEIKNDLECYIYDKYFFDTIFYFDDELLKELNHIQIEKHDGSIEYLDGSTILSELREYFGICDLEVDFKSLYKNGYSCIIQSKNDESIFYNGFYNGDFGDEYTKKQLKENHYTLQDICKYNGFNINDIFYYQKGDEKSKRFQKAKNLYENNSFFKGLYKEYNNYLGYMNGNITNIVNLSIDEILSFYVKGSKFSFGGSGLLGINDSIYELSMNKVLDIPCDKLDLGFYKKSNIEKTYDFNTRYFE